MNFKAEQRHTRKEKLLLPTSEDRESQPTNSMKEKLCEYCEEPFSATAPNQRYCSQSCAEEAAREKKRKRDRKRYINQHGEAKVCSKCGKKFYPKDNFRYKLCDTCRNPMTIKVCKHCGADFETDHAGNEYCSEACRTAAKNERQHERRVEKKTPPRIGVCAHCGLPFTMKRIDQKYCCRDCRLADYAEQVLTEEELAENRRYARLYRKVHREMASREQNHTC